MLSNTGWERACCVAVQDYRRRLCVGLTWSETAKQDMLRPERCCSYLGSASAHLEINVARAKGRPARSVFSRSEHILQSKSSGLRPALADKLDQLETGKLPLEFLYNQATYTANVSFQCGCILSAVPAFLTGLDCNNTISSSGWKCCHGLQREKKAP
ncbi:hypothetical protein ETB97_012172 [Aspergillus alliaceus]|uniref:Uncharacterized protein n=1 Tax=Petromyces alliaceus TaxID=209559 RepID=A0A8H6A7K8_PETAA|nr:hypothetical protein ETB97_012172 [Aspergillus burnettii]